MFSINCLFFVIKIKFEKETNFSVTPCFSISAAKSLLHLQLRECLRDGARKMLKYNYGFFYMFSIGFYFSYAYVLCLEQHFWHIFLEVVIVYICLWFGPLMVSMLEQNHKTLD